jgi:hypothetical protein
MAELFIALSVLAIFAVIIAVAVAMSGHRLGGRTFRSLADLSREVSTIVGLPAEREAGSWYRRLDELSFAGPLRGGRRAKVDFFSETVGSSTTTYVRFFVEVGGAPSLSIRPEWFSHKLGKLIGVIREVEIGVPEFDDRYLLEDAKAEPTKKLLSQEMRSFIDDAFARAQPRAVRFTPTGIVVEAAASSLDPDMYPAVLTTLLRCASLIDAKRVRVRVLGGTRRLVVGPRGAPRCAYCRADVTGEEPDLVACERCTTVVHAACWDEHGRCPIYGCEGRSAERGRDRARA